MMLSITKVLIFSMIFCLLFPASSVYGHGLGIDTISSISIQEKQISVSIEMPMYFENPQEKMYIRAEVEMIPEIDENISLIRWKALIELWKNKIIHQALPQIVDSHALDHVLEQYYLNSDTPTIDYIYSLAALGAKDPNELQPLLEAPTIDDLIEKTKELLTVK